jgi:hypothetical protein
LIFVPLSHDLAPGGWVGSHLLPHVPCFHQYFHNSGSCQKTNIVESEASQLSPALPDVAGSLPVLLRPALVLLVLLLFGALLPDLGAGVGTLHVQSKSG